MLWMVAFTKFSCVSYTYLHVQQKYLSSHTKTGGDGGVAEGEGGNNSINIILFYDFHQSLSGNNNLRGMRDMILSYDSFSRRPIISLLVMINGA